MKNSTRNNGRHRSAMSAIALLLLTLTAGCAVNSEMTNVWHDATLAPGSVHNVLVVGIRKDPVRRRMWEDAFVNALTSRGVAATASYKLYAEAAPDTQQVIDAVGKNGYDGVLTSIRLPNETTSRYIPGALRQEQEASQGRYGRLHTYWVTVQDPGYTETDTIIQIQTDLWTASPDAGRLVWSGLLRTLESVTGRTADKAVSREIMPEMEKQGVVPAVVR